MLRNFLYLDERQLSQYISQVEDGLRRASSRSATVDEERKMAIDAKLATFGAGKSNVNAESLDYDDDGPARFQRLQALVEGESENFGWFDLEADPEAEAGLRTGHIVEFAAEVYRADVSQLSGASGIMDMLPFMQSIGRMTGKPTGLERIDPTALEAISEFSSAMKGNTIVLGERSNDAKFVAQIAGDIAEEGTAYVVGKVVTRWGAGEWKPLPGIPVFAQLPREQRRKLERDGPGEGSKMMWLEGPAMQLNLLAVYQ